MPLVPPQSFRKTEFIHRIGLAAARPAAADVLIGTLYLSTDTLVLERSNGTVWASYSPSPAVNSIILAMLAQIATQTVLGRSAAGTGDVSALTTLPNTIQDNITRLGTIILGFVTNAVAALTTAAESWIGPSSTTGVYFKGGFVGLGNTGPWALLSLNTQTVVGVANPLALSLGGTYGTGTVGKNSKFRFFDNGSTTDSYGVGISAGLFELITGSTADFVFFKDHATAPVELVRIKNNGQVSLTAPITLKNYTVATLPAGTRGDIAYVTDALAPAFLAIIVGGGAVVTPVFYNGANWVGF